MFSGLTSLEKVGKIADSVQNMSMAFYGCTDLKTIVNIPANVQSMAATFYGCTSLTSIPDIPDGVEDMTVTFYNCNNLVSLPIIPSKVKRIAGTFSGCTKLTGIIKIENADNIEEYAYTDSDGSKIGTFTDTTKEIILQGQGSLEKFNSLAATSSAGNVKVDEANIIQPPQ